MDVYVFCENIYQNHSKNVDLCKRNVNLGKHNVCFGFLSSAESERSGVVGIFVNIIPQI